MAPACVEDLEPGRAALSEHETAPAMTELSENKIHAAARDEERHHVVREIGRNKAGVEAGGVIVAGTGKIIRKAILQIPSEEIQASGLVGHQPELHCQRGAVIANPTPVSSEPQSLPSAVFTIV